METDHSQLEKLLSDESFQRWISETASETENQKWTEWLNSDQKHYDIFDDAMRVWNAIQFQYEALPDTDREWKKLSHRLNLTLDSDSSNYQASSKGRADRGRSYWGYLAIAASILLILLLRQQLIHDRLPEIIHPETVHTDFGQCQDIYLSDRAHIILNANSTIEYPENVSNIGTIKINLKGEAYFDVYPQDHKNYNFIVETKDGQVEVVGTKFVINTRETGTKVVVESGAVRIMVGPGDQIQKQNPQTSLILESGNLLKFRQADRSLRAIPVNVEVHTSWRTDHLVFDNTLFRDIAQRLEKTYNIKIQVEDHALLENRVSGSIENSDPDIIFQAIAKVLGVEMNRKGNTVFFENKTRD